MSGGGLFVFALTLPLRGGPSPASQERESFARLMLLAEKGAGPGHGGLVRAALAASLLSHKRQNYAPG